MAQEQTNCFYRKAELSYNSHFTKSLPTKIDVVNKFNTRAKQLSDQPALSEIIKNTKWLNSLPLIHLPIESMGCKQGRKTESSMSNGFKYILIPPAYRYSKTNKFF